MLYRTPRTNVLYPGRISAKQSSTLNNSSSTSYVEVEEHIHHVPEAETGLSGLEEAWSNRSGKEGVMWLLGSDLSVQ